MESNFILIEGEFYVMAASSGNWNIKRASNEKWAHERETKNNRKYVC